MAESTYISWNAPNFITIVLMVSVAGLLFGVVAKIASRNMA